MAAYPRVDGLVTCGLTACTLGSAPGPTLGNEYGRTYLYLLPVAYNSMYNKYTIGRAQQIEPMELEPIHTARHDIQLDDRAAIGQCDWP